MVWPLRYLRTPRRSGAVTALPLSLSLSLSQPLSPSLSLSRSPSPSLRDDMVLAVEWFHTTLTLLFRPNCMFMAHRAYPHVPPHPSASAIAWRFAMPTSCGLSVMRQIRHDGSVPFKLPSESHYFLYHDLDGAFEAQFHARLRSRAQHGTGRVELRTRNRSRVCQDIVKL